jgi:hypothetical protein
MIGSTYGRRIIAGLILFGFLGALLSLWFVSRGGAATFETASPIISKLLQHFVPLLAIVGGFYFSERAVEEQGRPTTVEALILATVLIGCWAVAPSVLLLASDTLPAAMRLLDSVAVIGTSLASACLAFYFSKSGKAARPRR